jgi:hypothetical protein
VTAPPPALDLAALGKSIAASLVAGIVLTAAFCGLLYGADVLAHVRRDYPRSRIAALALLAVVSGAVFVAAVVLGIVVMASK